MFDAVGIVSKDLERSVAFYALLGLEIKEEAGPDHYQVTTESGVRIMLDSVKLMKQINPDWQEPVGSGVSLCFKQSSSERVDEIYKKITDAGFKSLKAPWDAFWGQRYASVFDPDGNQVDIFAPL